MLRARNGLRSPLDGEGTRRDLNEIIVYIAQDNPLAAERLGDELAAEANSLSNYPYRGGLVRRRRNVRRLVHGSYLIVYRIFESNRRIEILRFWHGARGAPRLR